MKIPIDHNRLSLRVFSISLSRPSRRNGFVSILPKLSLLALSSDDRSIFNSLDKVMKIIELNFTSKSEFDENNSKLKNLPRNWSKYHPMRTALYLIYQVRVTYICLDDVDLLINQKCIFYPFHQTSISGG